MNVHEQETFDGLINGLANDLKPVKPLQPPAMRALLWLCFTVLYYVLFIALTNYDLNWDQNGHHPEFIYELITLSILGTTASFASFYLCLPDAKERLWIVVVPLVLLGNFIVWLTIMGMADVYESPHEEMAWNHCLEGGFFLAGIPATLIIMMSRKGATTRPMLLGAMNMLAVASLSAIVLRLCCSETSLAHISVFHILPYLVLGAIAGFFARKIYRW